ncbi:MAG: DNA topoisomerase-1 [Glaciecola sp.]|jgi:DNA topoisomerase-1
MKLVRKRKGRGFAYQFEQGDWLNTSSKKDSAIKAWINSLAIPPAWEDVQIDLNKNAKVHAVGRDVSGKKQYIYNPDWRAERSKQKFQRIQKFATKLKHMRRVTGQDLNAPDDGSGKPARRRVLACMVRLIDTAYFRPGNSQYTQENESYGLTTLRSKHLRIEDDELVFEYNGKSGMAQRKEIEDKRLSKIVEELDELPGHRIFKYYENGQRNFVDSEDLNLYIKEIMGDEFSAKDFRSWAGTALMAIALAELDITDDQSIRDKNILRSIEKVAKKLGNTPVVCKENYIDSRIIDAYTDGKTINHIKKSIELELASDMLSVDEYAILKLLETSV